MSIRVGINGLGRIGKGILSAWIERNFAGLEIVMANDMMSPAEIVPLLKYDSVHGRLPVSVEAAGDSLSLGSSRKILFTASTNPAEIPWDKAGVQVVLECTGLFTDAAKARAHLRGGVKKVVISAPAKDPDATVVMGVNDKAYDPARHHVLSNASCTTNCLAPVAMVLQQTFGIDHGLMTTIHSYTNDQNILDKFHKDARRARAGALSMIPTTTGAAKAIGVVLPELAGKLDGLAMRVPTPNVSIVDLVAEVKRKTTADEVKEAYRKAAAGPLKGILSCTEDPVVSADFNGCRDSAIVDLPLTTVVEGRLVKVMAWYDNETGFSHRMLDLAILVGKSLQ